MARRSIVPLPAYLGACELRAVPGVNHSCRRMPTACLASGTVRTAVSSSVPSGRRYRTAIRSEPALPCGRPREHVAERRGIYRGGPLCPHLCQAIGVRPAARSLQGAETSSNQTARRQGRHPGGGRSPQSEARRAHPPGEWPGTELAPAALCCWRSSSGWTGCSGRSRPPP